jgi:hypothetical protein
LKSESRRKSVSWRLSRYRPPPREKRRQKLPPWLRNRFYGWRNKGSTSEGKAKHAAAGAFCAPPGESTLLPVSNAAPDLAGLRITNDPGAYADFLALTSRPSRLSMTGKVDSKANRQLMNKTYYGYIRVSTARQGVRGVSLQAAGNRTLGGKSLRLARRTLADYGIGHAAHRSGHLRIPGTLAEGVPRNLVRGRGATPRLAALGTLRAPRRAFAAQSAHATPSLP